MTEAQNLAITIFLNKVEIVGMHYQKFKEQHGFNIFNLLDRKFDEVNLHSLFLYDLLHPGGSHGMGISFLKKFLEHLDLSSFSITNISVRKEHKKIDLLITNGTQAIIIENKLLAIDQDRQLQRYYEIVTEMGYTDVKIYYLSINGKEAESYSIGSLSELPDFKNIVQNLSYQFDINNWLELCIKEAYSKATLRETLVQYRSLIQEISGKTMSLEEEKEMVQLISQNDNILHAKKVAENWNHVRWHTEWRFWTNLELLIGAEYPIMELQKYSDKSITSNIHQSRNRNPWHGLIFPIGKFGDEEACIFIERGQDDVYYGLTLIKNNEHQFNKSQIHSTLVGLINNFSEWPAEDFVWLGGNYCNPRINFEVFSNDTTLKLLNDDFRTLYLSNLWREMQAFITQCKTVLHDVDNETSQIIIVSE